MQSIVIEILLGYRFRKWPVDNNNHHHWSPMLITTTRTRPEQQPTLPMGLLDGTTKITNSALAIVFVGSVNETAVSNATALTGAARRWHHRDPSKGNRWLPNLEGINGSNKNKKACNKVLNSSRDNSSNCMLSSTIAIHIQYTIYTLCCVSSLIDRTKTPWHNYYHRPLKTGLTISDKSDIHKISKFPIGTKIQFVPFLCLVSK